MKGPSNSAVTSTVQSGAVAKCIVAYKLVARLVSCFSLFAACLFALPAYADMYFGVKTGSMMVDIPTDRNPWNFALNLGYRLDTRLADLSLAGEINRTLREGETRNGENLEFESEAVYLVWKTPRSLFVSLRGGIVRDKIIIGSNASRDDDLFIMII